MVDMEKTAIFGSTETWLKMNSDILFWEVRSENCQYFRNDKNFRKDKKIRIYITKQVEVAGCSIYLDHSMLKNVQILPQPPNLVSTAFG